MKGSRYSLFPIQFVPDTICSRYILFPIQYVPDTVCSRYNLFPIQFVPIQIVPIQFVPIQFVHEPKKHQSKNSSIQKLTNSVPDLYDPIFGPPGSCPDPKFICMDPDPDSSINKQKMQKNLDIYCFVTSL